MTAAIRSTRLAAAVVVLLSGLGSCEYATDISLIEISGTGSLSGRAFLDLDGNGVLGTADASLRGVTVSLTAESGGATLRTVATDSAGSFSMPDVPVGRYVLRLDSATVLGDSLLAIGAGSAVTIDLGTNVQSNLGASYPELSIEDVRAAVPGRRVFTKGIVLNPRQSFGDGMVHIQEDTLYLRTTNVQPSGLSPGDSVRMLGRTAVDNGQPTLNNVTPYLLRALAAFVTARQVTIGQAKSAGGGRLDAALVRIDAAEIGDTSVVNGDLHFWAHNGVDSVEVVFRLYLGITPNPPIRPDTTVRISRLSGLLRPFDDGSGLLRWRLFPRGGADVSTELKLADVAVATSFDRGTATTGDMVQIVVTARNTPGSSHTATDVQVSDTIPAGLTVLSATATQGTFDQASGLWTVGNLTPGAIATLSIDVRVDGGPGQVVNRARSLGLKLQIETNPGNDAASATLVIS